MAKLLIVDDDEAMLRLYRVRLSDRWEIIQTSEPEQALALALEHKPQAILLDLMMPKFTGFELVQSLHNLSYTAQIPLFVITGESAEAYNEHCANLGARCVFQKPIDFKNLKTRLASELEAKRPERRQHVRGPCGRATGNEIHRGEVADHPHRGQGQEGDHRSAPPD